MSPGSPTPLVARLRKDRAAALCTVTGCNRPLATIEEWNGHRLLFFAEGWRMDPQTGIWQLAASARTGTDRARRLGAVRPPAYRRPHRPTLVLNEAYGTAARSEGRPFPTAYPTLAKCSHPSCGFVQRLDAGVLDVEVFDFGRPLMPQALKDVLDAAAAGRPIQEQVRTLRPFVTGPLADVRRAAARDVAWKEWWSHLPADQVDRAVWLYETLARRWGFPEHDPAAWQATYHCEVTLPTLLGEVLARGLAAGLVGLPVRSISSIIAGAAAIRAEIHAQYERLASRSPVPGTGAD